MRRFSRLFSPIAMAGVALALLAPLTRPALADAPPWPNSSYAFYAQDDSLRDILETFGRSFGIRTEITPAVRGRVDGRLFAETPDAFLDKLADAHGIEWYYNGGVLHISAASEGVREAIEMTTEDVGSLRDALNGVGVLEEKFGWGEFPERGVVMVSGPPSYVALVKRTLATLPAGRSGDMVISVFRLKHASVDDRTFTYRDRQVTIPGVATILRNIITNQSYAGTGTRTEQIETVSIPGIAGGRGVLRSGVPPIISEGDGDGAGRPESTGRAGGRVDAPTESPVIQADTRLNAVIVKDIAERMPSYAELIELLDVPTALIEIEAAVVDINTNRIGDLGIRWQGQNGNLAGGFGTIGSAQPTDDSLALGIGSNANLQTILTGTGAFFLSKISALEQQGDASILSRPSVMTLDNLEAVLDLSETFYIRVEGERVADVVPVTAGVLLKVTPRLIEQNGERRIQLAVDVEDGTIQSDEQISELPTVRRSTISTQAVVSEHQSLLIGGYYFETDIKTEEKVPLLGDIPLLGLLFSREGEDQQQRERMFMITPRIIEAPGSTIGRPVAGPRPPPDLDAIFGRAENRQTQRVSHDDAPTMLVPTRHE